MTDYPRLIALAGRAGAGKNAVGEYLARVHGYLQIAFADPLRAGLKAMFGIDAARMTPDEKLEPIVELPGMPTTRHLLQTLGTEWGRERVHPDIWLGALHNAVERFRIREPGARFVVTDCRFINEAQWVERQAGSLWHIRRPGAGLHGTLGYHPSETPLRIATTDTVIDNDGTLDQLGDAIECALVVPSSHVVASRCVV